jgi:hypothetical protein
VRLPRRARVHDNDTLAGGTHGARGSGSCARAVPRRGGSAARRAEKRAKKGAKATGGAVSAHMKQTARALPPF